jgi:hypothetical protein
MGQVGIVSVAIQRKKRSIERFLHDVDVAADPAEVLPELVADGVRNHDERVDLPNAGFPQEREATFDDFPTDPMTTVSWGDGGVMQIAYPTVVSAEHGGGEFAVDTCSETEAGIAGEKSLEADAFVEGAQSNSLALTPKGVCFVEIGRRHGGEHQLFQRRPLPRAHGNAREGSV